jgi:ABC-2 type transport system ATP-binding protein
MSKGLIKDRTEYLLKLVNLQDTGKLSLRHYSKGMLERIGLASSLINDPKILILDEPTTGLDPIGCKETRDLLIKLKEAGKTILLSSHFLSEVERVCSRIAIFHRGNLLTTGVLADLLNQYQAENLEDLFVKTIETFDSAAEKEKSETAAVQ